MQFILFTILGLWTIVFRSMAVSKPVVFVVMGCAIPEIQSDRVQTAINYAKSLPENTDIFWFLTGGVKHEIEKGGKMPESERMATFITDTNVILDIKAVNTAENFANFKKWLYNTFFEMEFPKIIITTSEFHKTRASKIWDGIFESSKLNISWQKNRIIDVEWNLGKEACTYCWSDEPIHMQNVDVDIRRALLMLDM